MIVALLNQKGGGVDKTSLALQLTAQSAREPEGKRAFTAWPGDPDTWFRAPGREVANDGKSDHFTAPWTIDITPALRRRIEATAFQRGITVVGTLCELLIHTFPDDPGDRS